MSGGSASPKSRRGTRLTSACHRYRNEREIVAGGERFGTGKPQARFAQLAAKQMRHKI